MTTYNQEERYYHAKKKVDEIKGFYANLFLYLVFIPFFIWLNSISTSFPWAIFPIVGWGIGVFFHGMETYNYSPILGKDWEKRKIKELMDRDDELKPF